MQEVAEKGLCGAVQQRCAGKQGPRPWNAVMATGMRLMAPHVKDVARKEARRAFRALVRNAAQVFSQMHPADCEAIRAVRGTPTFVIDLAQLSVGEVPADPLGGLQDIGSWWLTWEERNFVGTGMVQLHEVNAQILVKTRMRSGDGARTLAYEFSHDALMLVMSGPARARIDLMCMRSAEGAAALALYEECEPYGRGGCGATDIHSVEEWAWRLAGGSHSKSFKDFHRHVLAPALSQIHESDACAFDVDPVFVYGARRNVVAMQFQLTLREEGGSGLQHGAGWSQETVARLRSQYGVSGDDVRRLASMCTQDLVCEAMEWEAVQHQQGEPVGAPVQRLMTLRGYLRGSWGQDGEALSPSSASGPVELRKSEQQLDAERRQLRKSFEAHQQGRLAEEMSQLPPQALAEVHALFNQTLPADSQRRRGLQDALQGGGGRAGAATRRAFLAWLMKSQPELAGRVLRRHGDLCIDEWAAANS